MEPLIKTVSEKKLTGQRMRMSLVQNKTHELWSRFMPRRKEIQNTTGTELYSIQVYDPFYFENFNPGTAFEKWAAIEVSDSNTVPDEMESFILSGGLYAVFLYKGNASGAEKMFRYIFETWLPASEYKLDHRPHFEILGEKYKNGDPDSEEEIWIPVQLRK